MNNDQMAQRLRELYEAGNLEALGKAMDEMSADDIVQEWPQSGERIRGKKNIDAVNNNYPAMTGTSPSMKLRRILKPGEAWVIEGTIDYGDGVPVSAVSIVETGKDGKVSKMTQYFANPFEAPDWRRKWVEHMEPVAAR